MGVIETRPSRLFKRISFLDWRWVELVVVNANGGQFYCSRERQNRGLIWCRDRIIKGWITPDGPKFFNWKVTAEFNKKIEIEGCGPLPIVVAEMLTCMADLHLRHTIRSLPEPHALEKMEVKQ